MTPDDVEVSASIICNLKCNAFVGTRKLPFASKGGSFSRQLRHAKGFPYWENPYHVYCTSYLIYILSYRIIWFVCCFRYRFRVRFL